MWAEFIENIHNMIASASAWSALHPELVRTLAVAIIGAFAVILAATITARAQIRSAIGLQRKKTSNILHIWKVCKFDPGKTVGNYLVGSVCDYLPIAHDNEIKSALREGRDLLITGRPGIGKSHAAIHNLQIVLPGWHLIVPSKTAIQMVNEISIRKKRYVLLLDDLNEFVRAGDPSAGQGVLDLVERIRTQSKKLIVIATIRRTSPEFDEIALDPKLLARWKQIVLSDWSDEQGQKLAEKTGIDFKYWDHTPLSLKQPSQQMLVKYERASHSEKTVIRSLAVLKRCGLKPVNRQLLKGVYAASCFGGAPAEFEPSLSAVNRLGFLRQAGEEIEGYDPHIECINDWMPGPVHFKEIVGILVCDGRVEELLLLSKFRIEEGKLDESLQALECARTLRSDWEMIPYRMGIVYARMRRWSDAEREFQITTDMKPGWSTAWIRLSNAFAKQGKQPDASKALMRANSVGINRDPIARGFLLAKMLHEDGRDEEALAEYDAILQVDREDAKALFFKGRVLRKLERWKEAKAAHEAAVKSAPEWAEAYLGLAEPLRYLGDSTGARRACEKAIKIKPMLEAYVALGHLLLHQPDLPAAEAVLQEGLHLYPESARLHSYLGELCDIDSNHEAAEDAYRKAVELDPNYKEAYNGLAKQLRLKGDFTGAIDANNKALDIDPEFAEGHFGLGLCYIKLKDNASAIREFRQAIHCSPQFAAAHYYLGLFLQLSNENDKSISEESIEELKIAMKYGYSRKSCLLAMAKAYCRLDHLDDAFQCLEEGILAGLDPLRIARDGAFTGIRKDARFRALIGGVA